MVEKPHMFKLYLINKTIIRSSRRKQQMRNHQSMYAFEPTIHHNEEWHQMKHQLLENKLNECPTIQHNEKRHQMKHQLLENKRNNRTEVLI